MIAVYQCCGFRIMGGPLTVGFGYVSLLCVARHALPGQTLLQKPMESIRSKKHF